MLKLDCHNGKLGLEEGVQSVTPRLEGIQSKIQTGNQTRSAYMHLACFRPSRMQSTFMHAFDSRACIRQSCVHSTVVHAFHTPQSFMHSTLDSHACIRQSCIHSSSAIIYRIRIYFIVHRPKHYFLNNSVISCQSIWLHSSIHDLVRQSL